MKEYKIITKSYETEEVDKVICDKCGKEIMLYHENKEKKERYVDINIKTRNTYCQMDMSETNQLCNDCARELYKWFDYKMVNDEHYVMDADYIDQSDDFTDED